MSRWIEGVIQNPKVGEVFEVSISRDGLKQYRYMGMGPFNSQSWWDEEGKTDVSHIPPYAKYRKLSMT